MEQCATCLPAMPSDMAYEQAKQKAIEQSNENKEPVALFKEEGEWKCLNAFTAYEKGYGPVIREVVSAHIGASVT